MRPVRVDEQFHRLILGHPGDDRAAVGRRGASVQFCFLPRQNLLGCKDSSFSGPSLRLTQRHRHGFGRHDKTPFGKIVNQLSAVRETVQCGGSLRRPSAAIQVDVRKTPPRACLA